MTTKTPPKRATSPKAMAAEIARLESEVTTLAWLRKQAEEKLDTYKLASAERENQFRTEIDVLRGLILRAINQSYPRR